MNTIESIYTSAATFLRDIFMYLFSGFLFLGLSVAILRLKSIDHPFREIRGLLPDSPEVTAGLLVIFSYMIGQFLFSLSFILFPIYRAMLGRVFTFVRTLDSSEKRIKDYLESITGESGAGSILQHTPVHLYFEMKVFVEKPELHRRFVERYNLLMFMKRSFSSCFFYAGVLCLVPPFTLDSAALMVFLLVLSMILFWRSIMTRIGFLDRVLTSYLIADENKEKE
ncbi:MAG: hypothetical protein GXO94_07385 [Nitrospirae bacterium]|nr:hypothetical protein [Nitrospirota bacterium]